MSERRNPPRAKRATFGVNKEVVPVVPVKGAKKAVAKTVAVKARAVNSVVSFVAPRVREPGSLLAVIGKGDDDKKKNKAEDVEAVVEVEVDDYDAYDVDDDSFGFELSKKGFFLSEVIGLSEDVVKGLLQEGIASGDARLRNLLASEMEKELCDCASWVPQHVYEWAEGAQNNRNYKDLLRKWFYTDKGAALLYISSSEFAGMDWICRTHLNVCVEVKDIDSGTLIVYGDPNSRKILVSVRDTAHEREYGRRVSEGDDEWLEREVENHSLICKQYEDRAYFGTGISDDWKWNFWFGEMRTKGIQRILDRCEQLAAKKSKPVVVDGFFYQHEGETINFTDESLAEGWNGRIMKRGVAVICPDYITQIGGDNGVQSSVGDIMHPVEMFLVENVGQAQWVLLSQFRVFPRNSLQRFLEVQLDTLKQEFLSEFIGQTAAKVALFSDVVAPTMWRMDQGETTRLASQNMIFVGPPGTGKTSFANLVGRVLFFCGCAPSGQLVVKTGADIGQGSGNADQASFVVQRVYQIARDGVLFIDELYGISPPAGEGQTSANQLAAISAITYRSLTERCCTIAAGYKHDVQRCFFKNNTGLKRRFKEIPFEPYDGDELLGIFHQKAVKEGLTVGEEASKMLQFLFGGFSSPERNGGFVEDLLRGIFSQLANRQAATFGPFVATVFAEDVIQAWASVDLEWLELKVPGSRVDKHLIIRACDGHSPEELQQILVTGGQTKRLLTLRQELRDFLDECCILARDRWTPCDGFYEAYGRWKGQYRESLGRVLVQLEVSRVFEVTQRGNDQSFVGVGVKEIFLL